MKNCRYYLSGAITGVEGYKKYFKDWEEELRNMGARDIFNPADVDLSQNMSIDAAGNPEEPYDWEAYMKHDIKVLMDCDCLVLLPNWRKSRGAKIEKWLCEKLNIRVVKAGDLLRELFNNAS